MITRSVRGHVAFVSALCGVLGVLITVLVFRWGTRQVITQSAQQKLAGLAADGEVGRCESSPSSWSFRGPNRASTFAYDLAGRSRNVEAPAVDIGDIEIARALPVGEVHVELRGFFSGGVILLHSAVSGPCAIAVSTWQPAFSPMRLLGFSAVLGGALGVGSSLLISLAGLGPLLRRISRVRRAATLVGEPVGYEPAEPGVDDDLGKVSAELDRAHARLLANAAHLENRRRDLQHHLANVAHDLRTPIASLQLTLEQAIAAKGDAASLDKLLTSAVRDLVYLGGLTANLRLASELEEGWSPVTAARTSLTDAVERATARVSLLAARKQIALEVALPDARIDVACDPTAAERAVANVVENAVIHGTQGGHVAVVLRSQANSRFELMVLDDGPGVAPEVLPRLGERTFRSDEARRRDPRGSGLGLAVSREVCDRCGWDLAFEREDPQGLRVTFRGSV